MASRRALPTIALGLAALGAGCGYVWVKPTQGVQVGAITDLSPKGRLGLVARAQLRRLAGEASGEGPSEGPRLSGQVRVLPEQPGGFDDQGATLYHAPVELDLSMAQPDGAVWRHRIRVDATFARGPTLNETWAGREIALQTAVERGVERWWARWTARGRR